MIHRSIPIVLFVVPLMACDGLDLGLEDDGAGGFGPGGAVTGTGTAPPGGSTGATGGGVEDAATNDMNEGGGPQSVQSCEFAPGSKVDISLRGHPSMAAAQYARAALLSDAHLVPATELVRSEDFLAYYGLTFHEGSPAPQVSLRWYPIGKLEQGNLDAAMELDFGTHPHAREPLRFVVLLDVSQSLSQSLDLEWEALSALAKGFAADAVPGDSLAVLTFAGDVSTVLDGPIDATPPYGGLPIDTVSLAPRSGNDFKSAVSAALTAADTGGGALGHVLLVSDGGTTITEELLNEIRSAASKGTRLSVAQVGVPLPTGPAPLDIEFLDQLAIAGRGASFYLGGTIDAERAFEERFGASFGIFARGVVAHIELPPFLQAIGLPTPDSGQSGGGPLGGVLGSGTLTPLRIAMRAGCTAIFDANASTDLPIEPFRVSIESQSGELLPLTEFDFIGSRGADAVSIRNDAILATALAIRSKKPEDVEKARELLGLSMNGNCLGCEDLMELMALLEHVE